MNPTWWRASLQRADSPNADKLDLNYKGVVAGIERVYTEGNGTQRRRLCLRGQRQCPDLPALGEGRRDTHLGVRTECLSGGDRREHRYRFLRPLQALGQALRAILPAREYRSEKWKSLGRSDGASRPTFSFWRKTPSVAAGTIGQASASARPIRLTKSRRDALASLSETADIGELVLGCCTFRKMIVRHPPCPAPPFCTTVGVTAGMDLALAIVQDDLGRDVALDIARRLVLFLKSQARRNGEFEPRMIAAPTLARSAAAERDPLRASRWATTMTES